MPFETLLLNADDETLTVADAELRVETNRPCDPFGDVLLQTVEPEIVMLTEPLRFSTYICFAALSWMLALVRVTVPLRFWNCTPLSPASLPAFFTSEFTSEKPLTFWPLMPICA